MRAKRFYCRRNKDAADDFIKALRAAGYLWVSTVEEADFLFMDHDWVGYDASDNYNRALRSKPMFIYPHTPYSYFLWDGVWKAEKVLVNFVVGQAAVESMRIYGYPYRVESIGFTGCPIEEFKPTLGTKLLFAPAHPLHDGKYATPDALDQIREVSHLIVSNLRRFERVTVRHTHTLEMCGLDEFKGRRVQFECVDPYALADIRNDSIRAMRQNDIVISNATFLHMAVAIGMPALCYGCRDSIANSREGNAAHYTQYKHLMHFPLTLEDMSIDEILDCRRARDGRIEEWKRLNIGEPFQRDNFLAVIKEYF